MNLDQGAAVCDIGAGVGHLTNPFANKGFNVVAVEPNNAMREHVRERTIHAENIHWLEATAENTKQEESTFDGVFFGSFFNVCDKQKALKECFRICKSGAWFACMWNHRDLKDPHQEAIENIIKKYAPSYDYRGRRKDQSERLAKNPLIDECSCIQETFLVEQSTEDCLIAWKSHETLARQVGTHFDTVIIEIEAYLHQLPGKIEISYETKIGIAKFKSK